MNKYFCTLFILSQRILLRYYCTLSTFAHFCTLFTLTLTALLQRKFSISLLHTFYTCESRLTYFRTYFYTSISYTVAKNTRFFSSAWHNFEKRNSKRFALKKFHSSIIDLYHRSIDVSYSADIDSKDFSHDPFLFFPLQRKRLEDVRKRRGRTIDET